MQLARVAVRRRDEALRFDARKLQQSPAAPTTRPASSSDSRRELAARGRTSGERAQRCRTGPRALRVASPCWAISSPARRRSPSQSTSSGRPLADRVHVACRDQRAALRARCRRRAASRGSVRSARSGRARCRGRRRRDECARARRADHGAPAACRRRRGPPARPRQAARRSSLAPPSSAARRSSPQRDAHRRLPGALAQPRAARRRDSLAQQRRADELEQRVGERPGSAGRSSPLTRSSISDSGPPSATATTGSPHACASRITWPKVSVALGNRNTSALA